MAQPNRQSKPDIEFTPQAIFNMSFDREFKVLAIELLGYNSSSGSLVRLEAVESSDSPGSYGLMVLNPDGTSIGTGSGSGGALLENQGVRLLEGAGSGTTLPTTAYLTETGDYLITESGDYLIQE